MTIPPLQEHFPSLVHSWLKGKDSNHLIVFYYETRHLFLYQGYSSAVDSDTDETDTEREMQDACYQLLQMA